MTPWAGFAAEPTQEELRRAVQQLADEDAGVRQKATQFLWEAGSRAESLLRDAAKSPDAEVSIRAAALLDKIRWGVFHDTPKEVVELIAAYRAADDVADREAALRGLLEKGSPGFVALAKMSTAESKTEARQLIKSAANQQRQKAVTTLLEEKKPAFTRTGSWRWRHFRRPATRLPIERRRSGCWVGRPNRTATPRPSR